VVERESTFALCIKEGDVAIGSIEVNLNYSLDDLEKISRLNTDLTLAFKAVEEALRARGELETEPLDRYPSWRRAVQVGSLIRALRDTALPSTPDDAVGADISVTITDDGRDYSAEIEEDAKFFQGLLDDAGENDDFEVVKTAECAYTRRKVVEDQD
jgi:hypothetical protein